MMNTTPGGNGTLVSFKGLVKRYGHRQVINGLDLDVHRGDIFGFIGPNGAGKTTSIKMMIGLLTDFEGDLSVAGLRLPDERRQVHRGLGYLPQDVAFQDWRTVDHVLSTFGKLSGIEGNTLEERIHWALSLLSIEELRYRRVNQISGGEHQKVGMAQAILHRPDLIVLDEPMVGLDPESRYRFKEVIRQLNKEGATIFFSSHILSDVQDVATRMGILSYGRMMWSGTMDDLKDHFGFTHDYQVILSHDSSRLEDLETIEGVISVERVSDGNYIAHIDRSSNVDVVADALLRTLMDGGSRVRDFTHISPSLEQLYMRYVNEDRPGGGSQ